jgi:DNA-directed RNA polymerase specialized sigma24 family protein
MRAVAGTPADQSDGSDARFLTTRWSIVVAAGHGKGSKDRRAALEALCRTYWYPLYAFVRRRGYDAERAQDLTQDFFARFLEKNDVAAARSERGRFRSFLLASMKHFLANDWDREHALKRGGGRQILSFDAGAAETRYAREPAHDVTPERVFDRGWALTVLAEALKALRQRYARDGQEPLFDKLKPFITVGQDSPPYERLAVELAMNAATVRVAVHRLRQRYREALRAAVADTTEDARDVDDEIEALFQALAT